MRFHLCWKIMMNGGCVLVFIAFGHENNRNQHFVPVPLRPHLNTLFVEVNRQNEHGRNGQFCIYFTLDEVKTKKSTNFSAHTHRTHISNIVCMTFSSPVCAVRTTAIRLRTPLVSPIIIIWCRTMSSLFASWLLIRMLPLGIRCYSNRIRYVVRACTWRRPREVETEREGQSRCNVFARIISLCLHFHPAAAADPCNI